MKYVDFFTMRNGTAVRIARAELAKGVAVLSGDPNVVAELRAGIVDPMLGETLLPADGLAFMAALSTIYRTPYLQATDMIEEP